MNAKWWSYLPGESPPVYVVSEITEGVVRERMLVYVGFAQNEVSCLSKKYWCLLGLHKAKWVALVKYWCLLGLHKAKWVALVKYWCLLGLHKVKWFAWVKYWRVLGTAWSEVSVKSRVLMKWRRDVNLMIRWNMERRILAPSCNLLSCVKTCSKHWSVLCCLFASAEKVITC